MIWAAGPRGNSIKLDREQPGSDTGGLGDPTGLSRAIYPVAFQPWQRR